MNWVLLRGLGRHSEHWGEFPKLVEENFGEVMLIDLPGISAHEKNIPITISDIVDQIRGKFLENQKDKDWSILAISLGGMVALDWVHRYPEDFKQIVTINSSTRSLSKFYERMRPYAIKEIAKAMFEQDVRKREKGILELTCNLMPITDEVLENAKSIADKMTINKRIFLKQLLAATKFKTPDSLEIPYTVLAATHDRLASVNCSMALSEHFKAPIHIHTTAGHDLPADDPQWIIEKLKEI